jgi:hypothetical protein
MFKPLTLLAIPAAGVALLGASIVFAQQIAPGGEGIQTVAPETTPWVLPTPNLPDFGATPVPGSVFPVPTITTPFNNQPQAQNTPVTNNNTPAPSNLPPLLINGQNVPDDLRPIPEAKPAPSSTNLAAMTAPADPELRPLPEAKAAPSVANSAALTVIDPSYLPLPEAKPAPSAATSVTAAPPDLQPIPEAKPAIIGRQ